MHSKTLSRRSFVRSMFVHSVAAAPLSGLLQRHEANTVSAAGAADEDLIRFLEAHRKEDGGYGWLQRVSSHVTPTFAAVAVYRLLGRQAPGPEKIADFVSTHYPVPEGLSQQPLWRLDYEQAQVLQWLGRSMDLPKAAQWQRPYVYNTYFEQNGYPTLQHQAMAVRLRRMAGTADAAGTGAWLEFFHARRRSDGTFNNTLARDGSGGHVVNTLWAVEALDDLGAHEGLSPETLAWVRACQTPAGGFLWSPAPELGGVENMMYAWAAVRLLTRAGGGGAVRDPRGCRRWIEKQRGAQGGYAGSSGACCGLTATYYALETLRMLGDEHRAARRDRAAAVRSGVPRGLRIYSAQIEAPGSGSPAEAVMLADRLGIHLWTAKNSAPGWISTAQQLAGARRSGVAFAQGNEEYGTYTEVTGFGMYSHLNDLVAPASADLGQFPPQPNVGMSWQSFRDRRIRLVREHGGRMVWQFNENEELTRILLDEACLTKAYAAISSFHFGLDDFLEFEPFLMEWAGRIPMIGLQDAHGDESWWWAPQLANFRTLYLAENASYEGFVEALDRGLCLSVRHPEPSGGELQWSGARPEVRRYIEERQEQWVWWRGAAPSLPLAAVTLLEPHARFEAGAPDMGRSVRVRLRWNLGSSPNKPAFVAPQSEMVSLRVDDKALEWKTIATESDRYLLGQIPDPAARRAVAVVRDLSSGRTETIALDLSPAEAEPGSRAESQGS